MRRNGKVHGVIIQMNGQESVMILNKNLIFKSWLMESFGIKYNYYLG
jgi:hypothetical protein